MKKLVVMVSIYEAGEYIENRLINLSKLNNKEDIEIWCVNANSPDERDHNIPQKFDIKYIKLPERIRVYAAWNYIIENSKSKYITNANADDIVAPNCYSILMNELDHDNKIGFAYPSWYSTTVSNQQWETKHSYDSAGKPGQYNGEIGQGGVGHFPMWRRSLHDKIGLFDNSYKALADAEWWARSYWIAKTQFKWVNQHLALYLWRNGMNLWHREVNTEEWEKYHTKVIKYKSNS